jgi:hypothetical protein
VWLADNGGALSRQESQLTITFDGNAYHTMELPDLNLSGNELWNQHLKHVASEVYDYLNEPPTPPDQYEGPLNQAFLDRLATVRPALLARIIPAKKMVQALLKNRSLETYASLPKRFGVKANRFELLAPRQR